LEGTPVDHSTRSAAKGLLVALHSLHILRELANVLGQLLLQVGFGLSHLNCIVGFVLRVAAAKLLSFPFFRHDK
jgi:hypothetical protein